MMKNRFFSLLFLFIAMAAGQASAQNRFYIDDFVLSPDQAGERITIPVKASFESHVSAWDVSFVFPEGMTPVYIERDGFIPGPDMNQPYWYLYHRHWNDVPEWREDTANAYQMIHFDGQSVRTITPGLMAVGYEYDPDYDLENDDEPLPYGSVKWNPGEYQMFSLVVEVDESFTGGEIAVNTTTTCGWDNRFGNLHLVADEESYMRADMNQDGNISVSDVTALVDYIFDGSFYEFFDIDPNGMYDLIDVEVLFDYLLGGFNWPEGYIMTGYELLTAQTVTNAQVQIKGDLNGDGTLGIGDVTLLIQALLDGQMNELGDINGNGEVTIADVTELIRMLLAM